LTLDSSEGRYIVRITISTTGPNLDAAVDPRFGRCRYFIVVDPDTLEFETLDNTGQMASGGAGIASAQLVASKDVQAVLTGNCGPNAYQTLEAAGIEVVTGVSGKVRDAIEGYKGDKFKTASGPSVDAHHGMGRGIGLGLDKGIGNLEQDLDALRAQTQKMGQQLSNVISRLDSIEKRGMS
jgi:predicted Fe-Mo cluster-binding NifX family protein